MPNPKVNRECRQCGEVSEHYTRTNGRVVSPCIACQIEKQRVRLKDVRKDPYKLAEQREKWKKYKAIQRLGQKPPEPVDENERPVGKTVWETQKERNKMRARAKKRRRRPLQPPPKA
jgi:hypothetical protein